MRRFDLRVKRAAARREDAGSDEPEAVATSEEGIFDRVSVSEVGKNDDSDMGDCKTRI